MIGERIELEALKTMPQGVYLVTEDDREILLPNKYVPQGLQMGDKVDVFIYTDSEDRIIATTLYPKIELNSLAFLKAVDVNSFGAFFDWGMEKDLLVPFAEQATPVKAGVRYMVYLYKDEVTNRLVGSTKIGKYIKKNKLTLKQGDKVDLLVSGETEIGYKVIVNGKHYGMVFKNETFKPINLGDKLPGYVQRISEIDKYTAILFADSLNFNKPAAEKLLAAYEDYLEHDKFEAISFDYQFKAGELAKSLKKPHVAIKHFNDLVDRGPNNEHAPMALFYKAMIVGDDLGEHETAKIYYQEFIDKYPDHPFAESAKASIALEGKDLDEIVKGFEEKNS